MAELSKTTGEQNPFPEDNRASYFVHAHKDDFINELQAIARGVRNAADTLPEKRDDPIPLRIALQVERLFWENQFKFTTSETSFAGECLRASLGSGGLDKDRVDYWLTLAKNHHNSMTTFTRKYPKI